MGSGFAGASSSSALKGDADEKENLQLPNEMKPVTTCVLFPGLDAALGTPKIRRWLAAPDVAATLDEAAARFCGRFRRLLTGATSACSR